MRPLAWKEMRDLRLWVLGGMALVAGIELAYHSRPFRLSFEGGYLALFMPVLLAVAAVGLAVSQIARERHTKTLDYLLVRPVSASTIVWTKFLVGTAALVALVALLVGLAFIDPVPVENTGVRWIRDLTTFPALALALFPRYWCAYALTLFFSVLADRSAKVASVMVVLAITLVWLAETFTELAPFSSFVYWLPYIETTGGLMTAARSAALSWWTGLVYCGAALLITAVSAALLKRSPERYLGILGQTAVAAGIVGAAVLSVHGALVRLPEAHPAGSMEFATDPQHDEYFAVASDGLVALAIGEDVHFLDFSQPAGPRQTALVNLPLWTTKGDLDGMKAAMGSDTLYLVGERKAVPVDQSEVAIVRPGVPVQAIPLGPVGRDYISRPVLVGQYLYLGITHQRQCSIRVFDLTSRQELTTLDIEQVRPAESWQHETEQPSFTLHRRGSYIYVATPSALTAVDIGDPAKPIVTGRVAYRPRLSFLYLYPRSLADQGDRLFQPEIWPTSLRSYSLADPAHPTAQDELTWHAGQSVKGNDHSFYMPWQKGVLESRVEGGKVRAKRVLNGGRSIVSVVVAKGMVYGLTGRGEDHKFKLQAFRTK